jgi:hypothetical protein
MPLTPHHGFVEPAQTRNCTAAGPSIMQGLVPKVLDPGDRLPDTGRCHRWRRPLDASTVGR